MYTLIFAAAILMILAASWCVWRFKCAGRDGRLHLRLDNESSQPRTLPNAIAMPIAADGWQELEVTGDHPHKYGPQRIELADLQRLKQQLENQAASGYWGGLGIFERHPTDGPALGWIRQFRIREKQLDNERVHVLEGLPEWNAEGRRRILENKEYKYASPSHDALPDREGNWRPVTLNHIGMTNNPNIKALRPWVNSETGAVDLVTVMERAVTLENAAWRDEFMAAIEALVADTEDRDTAIDALWSRYSALSHAAGQVERLIDLLHGLATAAGIDPTDDFAAVSDAVMASLQIANSQGDELARLRQQLSRAATAAVETGIAAKRVDPAKREQALSLANSHLPQVLETWFAPAKAKLPANPLQQPGKNGQPRNLANSLAGQPQITGPATEPAPIERIGKLAHRLSLANSRDYTSAYRETWGAWHDGGTAALDQLAATLDT